MPLDFEAMMAAERARARAAGGKCSDPDACKEYQLPFIKRMSFDGEPLRGDQCPLPSNVWHLPDFVSKSSSPTRPNAINTVVSFL